MPVCPRKSCAREHGSEMPFEAAPRGESGVDSYKEALWNGPVARSASGRSAGEAGTRDKDNSAHPALANLLLYQRQVRGCLRQAQERELQDTLLLFPCLPQEPQPSRHHLPMVNTKRLERSRKKLINL